LYYESLKKEYPKLNVGCFISKPFDMNYLVNKIEKELASGGVVYLDQHGNKIVDMNQASSNKYESFLNPTSFKDAIVGKSGSSLGSFQ
jgi:hypothetical protein